ncbi:MAG TPA: hypothetical protein VKX49_25510 [Bryobacteraceae bacterium]|nr:hypothetical protein [Bryobacteraceae bacterium]
MHQDDMRVQVFRSFEEAEKADRDFYRSLTPEQRLDILLQLIAQHGSSKGLERVFRIVKLEES